MDVPCDISNELLNITVVDSGLIIIPFTLVTTLYKKTHRKKKLTIMSRYTNPVTAGHAKAEWLSALVAVAQRPIIDLSSAVYPGSQPVFGL